MMEENSEKTEKKKGVIEPHNPTARPQTTKGRKKKGKGGVGEE